MVISIKGINTGVIRQNNEFIALALKIKEPRNKTSLFFLSPLGLSRSADRPGKQAIRQTSA